ncbi:MAG: LPXTG cell wall anchor domain-containing protein [Nitrososphaeraceae archaeon]|jgi:LPXTG-motif cell wall-anchored protein
MEVNGEIITGIALIFLSGLFFYAGTINEAWSLLVPADYLILAIGIGFLILGIITLRRKKKHQIA